ncbi:phenylalanine--tRNA ligase subunit beta [Pseudoroseomonas ludipueritiae]|uniref:Phenylalanine--tRNA ligase beta subunit n=1 Tax=Pseudoroseomonas ludipueritiae TaxID=198093 RepID=A0ABR7RDM6_9PROT|nr:phenylalanine--tRNA ligase subunit beta [Pseudoroseomonas ludipueritiae]MBC9179885.1 phenylalanine--tRNA ligase subunit beta [Pseudoroseomonas ludipueritiae]
MKFSVSWLKRHLETEATLEQITDTLNTIGLEVEGVEDRAAALAPFRIAHVIEAVQHPNADRLRACKVDVGDGVIRSVVCGAPNARTGMKAVLGLPGAFVPGTGITLKVGEIRGVRSEGMMCSSRELGLGEDHDGIIDLPADAPVGQPYAVWAGLDDPIVEISVTPNRGDALSIRGVARDLAAAGLGTLKPFAPVPAVPAYPSPLNWAVEDLEGCPWVLGRAVRGVKNGPSPQWLQDKLTAIGLRPINALVDVTNWFTYDVGRPLHVFDAKKVKGNTLTIRRGREGESFLALNGKEVHVTPEDLVIADAEAVESLAGIMGGEYSGSDEGTTEVFIEAALFDPVRIALSGRRHDLRSDARSRFERGVDQALPPAALEAATAMIIELCGGEASEIVSAGAEPSWQRTAHLRFERIAGLGGSPITPEEAVEGLERLGFTVASRDAQGVTVNVPSWRNDIASRDGALAQNPELPADRAQAAAEGCAAIEPECDLLEEVLRLRGLDAVPPVSLPVSSPVPLPSLTPRQTRSALARRVLAARGMLDCVSFGFIDGKVAALFGDTPAALRLENPIAADLDQMRPTPLASLLTAASRNAARGYPDVALAEIGAAYRDITSAGQAAVAAGIRTGETPRHWAAPARAVGAMDAKGDALAVLAALGVPMAAVTVTADAPGFYHPGRSGVVRQGPKIVLATFGEIHPSLRAKLDLPGPAVGFEVFLDAIPDPKRKKKGLPDLPAFQPLRRDFAFLVDATVPAENLVRAARGAERNLITEVSLFDRYAGEKLPEGKVSLALEVTLQPREASMTDAEIEAVGARIVAAVAKATGATLRG